MYMNVSISNKSVSGKMYNFNNCTREKEKTKYNQTSVRGLNYDLYIN